MVEITRVCAQTPTGELLTKIGTRPPIAQFAWDAKRGRWYVPQDWFDGRSPVIDVVKLSGNGKCKEKRPKEIKASAKTLGIIRRKLQRVPGLTQEEREQIEQRLLTGDKVKIAVGQNDRGKIVRSFSLHSYLQQVAKRHLRYCRYVFWMQCTKDHLDQNPRRRKTIVYLGKRDENGLWRDEQRASLKTRKTRKDGPRLKVYRFGHQIVQQQRVTSSCLADRLSPTSADREFLLAVEKLLGPAIGPRLLFVLRRSRLTAEKLCSAPPSDRFIARLSARTKVTPRIILSRLLRAQKLLSRQAS